MQKHTDLRVIRTRQMIKDAFLELMNTIGFSKITVENLTKKASISRNTFYLHYTDKYDLLDQLEAEMLNGVKDIITEMPIETIVVTGLNHERIFAVILRAFEYIKEHGTFFTLFMGDNGDPAFLNKLHETIKSVFVNKNMVSFLKIPEQYAIALIIGIQTSFIKEWINSGMKETPIEIVSIILSTVSDLPHKIFKTNDSRMECN